ncbi:hypothetical protein WJX72_010508 [[Myrmecia] bisecta]|uniref:Intraflagellar transport protein 80 n=1 Tax=[Myrmecia] bisecta TaxID=41462 RepID=A0AAW1Q2Y6_9CHLO
MRLQLTQPRVQVHKELASAVGWSISNELFSTSDDHTIHSWKASGEHSGQVCSLDAYSTDLHWYPCASRRQQGGATDVLAVSCTDGTFKILSKSGRVEKSVDAHRGAVICLRWNYEGTALATAGEDGLVKASTSPVSWKAHNGLVLRADWSPVNDMIVSGGEDCRYKVWDSFGRLLFQSAPLDHHVTAVAWCPGADLFAVGSLNHLQLCDRSGWAYSKESLQTGSILSLSWTQDGTQVAGCGGNGQLVFGRLADIALEWGHMKATLKDDKHIRVHNLVNETVDELDFRDSVVKMALGFEHLVVATSTQCCIYSTATWNTPHILDLKDTVSLILQCQRNFLTVDNFSGIQICTYEGRQVCNPKFQGLRTEFLSKQLLSLSNDTLAIVDKTDGKTIRFFDTAQGKPSGDVLVHSMDIAEVALSQNGIAPDRKVVFVDRNRDLYVRRVSKGGALVKLAPMVESAVWHDTAEMLATMTDQKLVIWYYVNVVFVDRDLIASTCSTQQEGEFGKGAVIQGFSGSRCTLRRSDGAEVAAGVPPYPLMLHQLVAQNQWDRAVRLCRFVKDGLLWACLAAMAVDAAELNTAEVAFAACEEVDKLQQVLAIKAIPSQEGRSAELALVRRCPQEAEAILLQAGLTYRAIQMNIQLFRWERALDLALKHKTHVDTVLLHRQRHLAASRRTENDPRFLQYAQEVPVDAAAVELKEQQEVQAEAQRPGARRYV